MEKQDAFTQALLRAIDAAEQEAGVRQPRLRRAVEQYGGIPPFPETQEFVRRVLVYWNRNIPADQPTHS